MKLEQNNKSLLFSETFLPDIFFSEYLNAAPGDFIKVYLYIVFLSKFEREIAISDLSKTLALNIGIIESALKYWEEQELIVKSPSGYIVNNLRQVEINKLYSPKISSSPDELKKIANNKNRAKAIESINTSCFQGIMSPAWYNDIDLWFKKYGFDEEVMIALFNYCFNKSALHRKYVETVAEAWKNNKIKTFKDLDSYYEKQEKLHKFKKSIMKKLGLSTISEYQEAFITKWTVDFGFGMDVIEIALKKTTSKSNINFEYLDKIFTDWHDRKLKTATDVENYAKNFANKTKEISKMKKGSYTQRKYDNLDNLYDN